jgi:hypothetical protein
MKPSNFCFKGLVKYYSDLQKLPTMIKDSIRKTDGLIDSKLENFILSNYMF